MRRVPRQRLSALPPLPPLVRTTEDPPGSAFRPAVEIDVPRDVPVGEAFGVCAVLRAPGGDSRWRLFAHAGGRWQLAGAERAAARRFAVATHLLVDRPDVETLPRIEAAASFLARRVGGTVGRPLPRDAIAARIDAIDAAVRAHGRLVLEVELDPVADAHDVRDALSRLGVVRSDVGTRAWDDPQRVGYDRLIVVDAGLDLDVPEPGVVGDLRVSVDLARVPVPELVVARAHQLALSLVSVFGGSVAGRDVHGRRFEIDGQHPDVGRHLAALRAVGFHRDVSVAPDP